MVGGSVEEKEEEEGGFIETDADACHFSESGSREGGIVLYKCHQSCEVEHCFFCFLSKSWSSAFMDAFTHTYTHTLKQ